MGRGLSAGAAFTMARPHDLLKLNRSPLTSDAPAWAHAALSRIPFAVVRRAVYADAAIPIGIRGDVRTQRYAAYAKREDIAAIVGPEQLLAAAPSADRRGLGAFVALAGLRAVRRLARYQWGPTGSAGFELATRLPTVSASSDLDLLVRAPDEMAPGEANLHNNYGNLQRRLGDLAGAEASLRRAIRLKATYPEAYLNLGVVLGDLGRHEEAVAALRRATVQRPGYADALMHIGVQLRELGKNEEALRSYDAALAAQPAQFAAHYNRGDVLVALARFEDALAAFDVALRLNPASIEARYARANTLARTGRHEEALDTYRQVIETAPDFLPAHQEYNALAWTMGREDLNFTSFAIAESSVRTTGSGIRCSNTMNVSVAPSWIEATRITDGRSIAAMRRASARKRCRAGSLLRSRRISRVTTFSVESSRACHTSASSSPPLNIPRR